MERRIKRPKSKMPCLRNEEVPVFFEAWDEGDFTKGRVYKCMFKPRQDGTVDLYFPGRGGKSVNVGKDVAGRILNVRDRFIGKPIAMSNMPMITGIVEALVLDEEGDDVDRVGLAVRSKFYSDDLYEVIFPKV